MTWKLKVRGAGGTMLAEYECPTHGRFDATVERDANSDPPATAPCPVHEDIEHHCEDPPCSDCGFTYWQCLEEAPWVPSVIRGRVKLGEVDQGKVMDYPTANVCLDTRPLADGMPYREWKAGQDKITRDINIKRHRERKNVLR